MGNHLAGKGCNKCGNITSVKKKAKSFHSFIKKSKKIYVDKCDYSKSQYINATTDILIICRLHGEFWQKPYLHLIMNGCKQCRAIMRVNTRTIKKQDKILKRIVEIHGDKYDLSKFIYTGVNDKSIVVCHKHGEFPASTNTLINHKHGCFECGLITIGNLKRKPIEKFIKEGCSIHDDKYNYSKFKKYSGTI